MYLNWIIALAVFNIAAVQQQEQQQDKNQPKQQPQEAQRQRQQQEVQRQRQQQDKNQPKQQPQEVQRQRQQQEVQRQRQQQDKNQLKQQPQEGQRQRQQQDRNQLKQQLQETQRQRFKQEQKPEFKKQPMEDTAKTPSKDGSKAGQAKTLERIKKEFTQVRQKTPKKFSPGKLQEFKNEWQKNKNNKNETAKRFRQKMQHDHPEYHRWFKKDFYDKHGYKPHYHWHQHNREVNWIVINRWLGGWWNYPVYYDDQGYPIDLDFNMLFSSDRRYDQAFEQDDWLPLGIFSLGKNPDQATYSNIFFQLAMDKEGYIAGTYFNAATDQVFPIEGYLQKENQLAVWKFAQVSGSPIMSTGIFNLMQDVVSIDVSFENQMEQSWVLIRVIE